MKNYAEKLLYSRKGMEGSFDCSDILGGISCISHCVQCDSCNGIYQK